MLAGKKCPQSPDGKFLKVSSLLKFFFYTDIAYEIDLLIYLFCLPT